MATTLMEACSAAAAVPAGARSDLTAASREPPASPGTEPASGHREPTAEPSAASSVPPNPVVHGGYARPPMFVPQTFGPFAAGFRGGGVPPAPPAAPSPPALPGKAPGAGLPIPRRPPPPPPPPVPPGLRPPSGSPDLSHGWASSPSAATATLGAASPLAEAS
eukprot:14100927-Alexandrium_andersonii.AAC.1